MPSGSSARTPPAARVSDRPPTRRAPAARRRRAALQGQARRPRPARSPRPGARPQPPPLPGFRRPLQPREGRGTPQYPLRVPRVPVPPPCPLPGPAVPLAPPAPARAPLAARIRPPLSPGPVSPQIPRNREGVALPASPHAPPGAPRPGRGRARRCRPGPAGSSGGSCPGDAARPRPSPGEAAAEVPLSAQLPLPGGGWKLSWRSLSAGCQISLTAGTLCVICSHLFCSHCSGIRGFALLPSYLPLLGVFLGFFKEVAWINSHPTFYSDCRMLCECNSGIKISVGPVIWVLSHRTLQDTSPLLLLTPPFSKINLPTMGVRPGKLQSTCKFVTLVSPVSILEKSAQIFSVAFPERPNHFSICSGIF